MSLNPHENGNIRCLSVRDGIIPKKNDAFSLALTGHEKDSHSYANPRTPEHSNIGSYEKGGKLANGSWYLYKVGTPEQLWSEIFATRLLSTKGVNVVKYWMRGLNPLHLNKK